MTITGADDGIDALNYGDGALSITTTGTTTGTTGYGIYAYNVRAWHFSRLTRPPRRAVDDGIYADNNGTGALSITTTGTTTGTWLMAFMRITLPQARLSRLTQPPRRAGTMAFMHITWHRRTEHHNNGYDNGHSKDGINAYNSSAGTSSRLTRPPRRAVTMALMRIIMAPAH